MGQMTDFIGRGEVTAKQILDKIFEPHETQQQIPITKILDEEQTEELGSEYNKHKFDLGIHISNIDIWIIIEVNLRHGTIAHQKWDNVYKPHLAKAGIYSCTIDNNECISLFDKNLKHPNWQDYIDVINALKHHNIPLFQ